MLIPYFEEAAYDKLSSEISKNAEKYLLGENWLDEYFQETPYSAESTIEVSRVAGSLLHSKNPTDEQKRNEDIHNVKVIYGTYKDYITPLTATNKYMWSCLCHKEFSEYIRDRWFSNPRDISKTIKTRFFMDGKDGKFDNAIARLWWYGYISYDESAPNPFHLTEILLSAQQICTDLIDESYSSNKVVVKAMLLALKAIKEEFPEKGLSQPWRDCVKYINRCGAVINLDFVGADKVYKLTYNYLKNKM